MSWRSVVWTSHLTATPTIAPSPGVVEQSPTMAPLPATVPAGGGGEAPGGLPIWALLALTAAVIAGIGASVRLSLFTCAPCR